MTMNEKDKPVQQNPDGGAPKPPARKLLRMAILHVRKTIETHQSKSLRPA